MKEFLEYIIKNLVSNPKDVKVKEETEEENIVTYSISANDEDKGKIIGRDGRVIKAIRDLLLVIAKRENKRIYIRVD